MALQVLFLLLCLFLGQESEVRAQHTAAQPTAAPDTPVGLVPSNIPFSTWSVTPGNSNLTILTSPKGNFSFNLLLTNQSISSCAAVVQHNSSKVTIWVANFNATDSGSGISICTLNFTKSVGLALSRGKGIADQEIWSSKNQSTGYDFDLLLLDDSGDLRMINQGSNVSQWNSFSSPTDTLVNGQSLNRSSIPLSAASLNSEFSNGGIFYMRINASSVTLSQDFKLNGTSSPMPYNSSTFVNLALDSIYMNKILQVNGRDNGRGNDVSISSGSSNRSWDYARLESNGGLVLKTFDSPEQNETLYPLAGAAYCSLPAQCGSFGICSGANNCTCPVGFVPLNSTTDFTCGRTEDLNTADCSRDQFLNVTGRTYMNLTYLNVSEAADISPEDCEILCNKDCGCTNALYVERNVTGSRSGACFINPTSMQTIASDNNDLQMWFFRIPPDVIVVPAPPPGDGSSTKSSRRTAASAFAGGAGAVLLVLLGVSFCWLFHSRRKLFDDADRGNIDSASMSLSQLPPQFSYEELEESTSNFNRRLGYGGFSSVYAGFLPDNSKIAVKILDDNGHPKEKEFLASMATVGGLSHSNLVPLRGFCSEGKHRMLVYELVNEGRSLNYFLFRPDSGPLMDAQTRRSIALETARGLAYLHEDLVIHGGVKPENIMIDREMHPRLVDYGLTNLMSRFQKLNFANERGSRAYMAPEWARSPPVTEKVDVYSFGVVLLELVSGRSCLILSGIPEEKRFLPTWGFSILRRGPDHLLELADPRLDIRTLSESDQQVLKGMTFIALWCVQEDPSKRPAMSHVVKMLDGDIPVNAPPLSPALDALATELCAGHGHGHGHGAKSPEGARFMNSPSVSENSEMRPSPFYNPSVESENSGHDHAWLLEKQQSL